MIRSSFQIFFSHVKLAEADTADCFPQIARTAETLFTIWRFYPQ